MKFAGHSVGQLEGWNNANSILVRRVHTFQNVGAVKGHRKPSKQYLGDPSCRTARDC